MDNGHFKLAIRPRINYLHPKALPMTIYCKRRITCAMWISGRGCIDASALRGVTFVNGVFSVAAGVASTRTVLACSRGGVFSGRVLGACSREELPGRNLGACYRGLFSRSSIMHIRCYQ